MRYTRALRYPPAPDSHLANATTLDATARFAFARRPVFAPAPVAPASVPRPNAYTGGVVRRSFDLSAPYSDVVASHERIVEAWRRLTAFDGRTLVGHRTEHPTRERTVLWVCGSRKHRVIEKRDRQEAERSNVSMRLEHARRQAVTERERDAVEAAARVDVRRRREARLHYAYSKCATTRLAEASLSGAVVQVDAHTYVACAHCLQSCDYDTMRYAGAELVCRTCACIAAIRFNDDASGGGGASDVTSLRCFACHAPVRCAERYRTFVMYDDVTVGAARFGEVCLCERHVVQGRWIQRAPTIYPLSTIIHGLKAKWGASAACNPTYDYLARMLRGGTRDADATGNLDDIGKEVRAQVARFEARARARAAAGADLHSDDTDDDDA